MSYIDQHLMPGESVIHRTSLHKMVFIGPLAFAVVFLIAAICVLVALPDFRTLGLFLLLIGVVGGGGYFLAQFVAFRTSEFAVTNQRVMIQVGWLRRQSSEILLKKVEGLSVDQSFLGRSFDSGSLVIGGTGGSKETFPFVRSPLSFRQQVQSLISAADSA